MREMFNRFMMLVERDYKLSRDVAYYASQMNITPKYLTLIVRQMTHETPKHIIDHYTILLYPFIGSLCSSATAKFSLSAFNVSAAFEKRFFS